MSELLAPVEEPPRICGHDALKNGGCKGKAVGKVKSKDCPIGAAIKLCREDNKRRATALKKTKAKAKAKDKNEVKYDITFTPLPQPGSDGDIWSGR
jgi:hypothetical protein